MKKLTKKSKVKSKKITKKRIYQRNPTKKDEELYNILTSIGEPTGFLLWIFPKDNTLEISPWIPEHPEWGILYPNLKFPDFSLNGSITPIYDNMFVKLANILGWLGKYSKDSDFLYSRARDAKLYLSKLHKKHFKSFNKEQALEYLDMYHEMRKIPGVIEKRVY